MLDGQILVHNFLFAETAEAFLCSCPLGRPSNLTKIKKSKSI